MDKSTNITETSLNHNIQITDRKTILITGVKKLESFDNKEFFVETVMGYIIIKGENLELLKLDTYQGTLSLKGKLFFLSYVEENGKKSKSESIIAKLFK